MKIDIATIPHSQQRYETVGDWYWKGKPEGNCFWNHCTLVIRVSKMKDWRHEVCVAIHELVEVVICKWTGITQKEVDTFDMAFEKNRKPGNFDEPGDDNRAPYRIAHCIATGVERTVAAMLGVFWKLYEKEIESL